MNIGRCRTTPAVTAAVPSQNAQGALRLPRMFVAGPMTPPTCSCQPPDNANCALNGIRKFTLGALLISTCSDRSGITNGKSSIDKITLSLRFRTSFKRYICFLPGRGPCAAGEIQGQTRGAVRQPDPPTRSAGPQPWLRSASFSADRALCSISRIVTRPWRSAAARYSYPASANACAARFHFLLVMWWSHQPRHGNAEAINRSPSG